MDERETPRSLDVEEIKVGIAQMVADAVYEKLGKTCNLYGRSYPKFKGTVTIHLQLDDFGDTVTDNSITLVEGGDGEIGSGAVALDAEVTIEEMPPNQFRVETDQPITKSVVEDGRTVVKKVKYQARKKGSKAKPSAAKDRG